MFVSRLSLLFPGLHNILNGFKIFQNPIARLAADLKHLNSTRVTCTRIEFASKMQASTFQRPQTFQNVRRIREYPEVVVFLGCPEWH